MNRFSQLILLSDDELRTSGHRITYVDPLSKHEESIVLFHLWCTQVAVIEPLISTNISHCAVGDEC